MDYETIAVLLRISEVSGRLARKLLALEMSSRVVEPSGDGEMSRDDVDDDRD